MTIRFRLPGEQRQTRPRFVCVPPARLIRFLAPPSEHVQVYTHWIGRYSVPCLGDECELCDIPPVLGGYAAVVVVQETAGQATPSAPGILYVSDNALEMLEKDMRCQMVKVWRKGDRPNGQMNGQTLGKRPALPPPSFSVLERMKSLWASRSRVPSWERHTKPAAKDGIIPVPLRIAE